MSTEHQPDVKVVAGKPETQPPIVSAERLFQGTREIWIDLEGVRYRLRITRRNRLILQK